MAEDVALLLGDDRLHVVPEVVRARPGEPPQPPDGPVLVAPRVWNDLDPELRARPELIEIRYIFRDRDLEAIADALGWKRRSAIEP